MNSKRHFGMYNCHSTTLDSTMLYLLLLRFYWKSIKTERNKFGIHISHYRKIVLALNLYVAGPAYDMRKS